MLQDAIRWVDEHPEVRAQALREARLDEGESLPDAIVADPTRLIDAGKALAIEAVRRDAPAEVVDPLLDAVRSMATTAAELDRYQFTLDVLAGMRGLRDESELAPILTRALDDGPDDANRQKLERMLATVRSPMKYEDVRADVKMLAPDGFSAPCCVLGCIVCTDLCLLCCAAGGILC
jgi:hypothetical protein